MKILLLVGKSGSGKTTLAKNLEDMKPSMFKRIVQYTSRDMRDGEIDGCEYHFITKNEFNIRSQENSLFAEVKREFPPSYYGTPYDALDKKKVNVVVASLEGVLDTLTRFKKVDGISILNIVDVDAEAIRNGRDSDSEEMYNRIVFEKLIKLPIFKKLNYVEVNHSDLKTIRNNPKELIKFMKAHGIK